MDDILIMKVMFLAILNASLLFVGCMAGRDEKEAWKIIAVISTALVDLFVLFKV